MAKDYRQLEPYKREEWENDTEWLGKRLGFIWDLMDIYPVEERPWISQEKNELYSMGNEVYEIAKRETAYNDTLVNLWKKRDIHTLYRDFRGLLKLKKSKNKEFFKKINSYYYIWIYDHRLEELKDYERENQSIVLTVFRSLIFE